MLQNYVTLDIETTGLSTKNGSRIVWISALKIKNKQVIGEFFYLLKTGARINKVISNLISIKQSDLKESLTPELVLPEFFRFAQDLPMVCHNAAFVKEFMEYECKLRNLDGFLTYLCTWEMAKKNFPGKINTTDVLEKRFGCEASDLNGHYKSDVHKVFLIYERLKDLNRSNASHSE